MSETRTTHDDDERIGRPRDAAIDRRVLDATRDSLIESGWEGTSIRGVAERAEVSRPAIGRRWPSKAHLVLETILGETPDLEAFADVDVDGWLSAVVDGSFELFERPEMRAAAPGLLATLRDHDDVRVALWEGFTGPATALLADGDGDEPLLDDVDARAAIVIAAGAALFATLVVDDPQVRDRVVDRLHRTLAP